MADYYGTVAGFKSYHTAHGNTALAATADGAIEVALLIASEWIDGAFRSDFGGLKANGRDQIREFPRSGVVDMNGYSIPNDIPPREIENATYEAAGKQITTPGIFFKDYERSKYKSVSISGALSVQYEYGNAYDFQTQMPVIAAILQPILTGIHGSMSPLSGRLVRN